MYLVNILSIFVMYFSILFIYLKYGYFSELGAFLFIRNLPQSLIPKFLIRRPQIIKL